MRRLTTLTRSLPPAAPGRETRATLLLLFLGVLVALAATLAWPGRAAAAVCQSSTPSSAAYEVTICISQPGDGASLTGTLPVGATVSVTGTSPGVQRVSFSLDGAHLLTDYTPLYLFSLPSDTFVDGPRMLEVSALMRDEFVSESASIAVDFANGVTSPPVNTNTFTPRTGTTPVPGAPFVLAATGDGASGEPNAERTPDLIEGWNPNLFLYLGDVYEKGSPTEFFNWYAPLTSWGALRAITNPTIGNHEYTDGVAVGYFNYWDNVPHYFSFEAGPWHVASIDSNNQYDGDLPGTPQFEWLDDDLAASSAPCKMVYLHHPVYSVGPQGGNPRLADLWALMVQRGVDIVMTAHEHHYQRWMPLDAAAAPDPNGATQFVAGGGGHGVTGFVTSDPRLVFGADTSPNAIGALRMELNPEGTSYRYVNNDGQTLDSGWLKCNGTPVDSTSPSAPTGLSAALDGSGGVALAWTAANDNVAVTGYKVFRGGVEVGTTAETSYLDASVVAGTTYAYTVAAVDGAENVSSLSNTATIATLPPDQVLTFLPTDDAYISSSSPNSNYGAAATLQLDSGPDRASLLKFALTGIGGWTVTDAKLRLRNVNSSVIGGNFYRATSDAWSEGLVTWNNAPAADPVLLASLGKVTSGNWYEVPVTAAVAGDGTVSFRVSTTSTDGADYVSTEGTAGFAPELVVTISAPTNPDTEAPSAPTGLSATAVSGARVDLAWTASTDNDAVAGYTVFRDGAEIGTATETSYSDTTVAAGTTYAYQVVARDPTGNVSEPSNQASATTPAAPQVLTFLPTDDTYLSASSPNKNYGAVTTVKLDVGPDRAFLLKFAVSGIGSGTVLNAKLRLRNVNSSPIGGNFHLAASNAWAEGTATWNNSPAANPAVLGSLARVSANNWYEVPVTAAVAGDGTVSFRVDTTSTDGADYASKEGTSGFAPLLSVTFTPPVGP